MLRNSIVAEEEKKKILEQLHEEGRQLPPPSDV